MFGRFKKIFENEPVRKISGNYEYIVVGLGNPGREYEHTRHNTGFMALDFIAEKYSARVDRVKFKSLCGDAVIVSKKVLLLKPQTFMNLSGEAVRDAASFYRLPMEKVIVIYDDVSLPVGKLRIRSKGSDGGHNGIKSIISLCSTDVFPRIKIGVGQKPSPEYDLASWVLGKYRQDDMKTLAGTMERILGAAEMIISGDVAEAMNRYNG